jgi:hypothetical protein
MIARFFIAIEMALQLGIDVPPPKDFYQLICDCFCFFVSAMIKLALERPIFGDRAAHPH